MNSGCRQHGNIGRKDSNKVWSRRLLLLAIIVITCYCGLMTRGLLSRCYIGTIHHYGSLVNDSTGQYHDVDWNIHTKFVVIEFGIPDEQVVFSRTQLIAIGLTESQHDLLVDEFPVGSTMTVCIYAIGRPKVESSVVVAAIATQVRDRH